AHRRAVWQRRLSSHARWRPLSRLHGPARRTVRPARRRPDRGAAARARVVGRGGMDIRYLQSFVTVVESGSFAQAARQLDLTSTAVAARVKALEQSLGLSLVKRAGRSVRATEAGLRII